jgi:hypothetical protein
MPKIRFCGAELVCRRVAPGAPFILTSFPVLRVVELASGHQETREIDPLQILIFISIQFIPGSMSLPEIEHDTRGGYLISLIRFSVYS